MSQPEEGAARQRHPTARRPPQRTASQSPLFVGIAFLIAVFNLLGLVMVLSASSVKALQDHGTSWYYVSRQALWALGGAGVAVTVARVDYHRWRRWATPMLVLSLVLLGLVLVVGLEANGARRWLGYDQFSVQPSELLKLTLLIWVADLLARRTAWIRRVRAGLRPVLLVLSLGCGLIMLQPNMGTTIVVAAIALSMCYVAGVPMLPIVRWGSVAAATGVVLAWTEPYRRARLIGFINPWDDRLDGGYQTIQSLVGLSSGGVAGSGLGTSRAKWGFLPFAHTDFVFSVTGEELGLVGSLVVLTLFGLLAVLGVRTALHASDRFGMLLAIGITVWFLVQGFMNMAAAVGVAPVTGVPLPFISFGGSSLVVSMAAVGLLLSVARQGTTPATRAEQAEKQRTSSTKSSTTKD